MTTKDTVTTETLPAEPVTATVIDHSLDIPDVLSRALHPERNEWPEGEQVPRGDTYKDPDAAFIAELEAKALREPSTRRQYPLTARDKEVIAELEAQLPEKPLSRRKDGEGSLNWNAFGVGTALSDL